jgi:hypothetical protein
MAREPQRHNTTLSIGSLQLQIDDIQHLRPSTHIRAPSQFLQLPPKPSPRSSKQAYPLQPLTMTCFPHRYPRDPLPPVLILSISQLSSASFSNYKLVHTQTYIPRNIGPEQQRSPLESMKRIVRWKTHSAEHSICWICQGTTQVAQRTKAC